jgi:hypothetical protein
MAKSKKGDKMHKGPGWELKSSAGTFTATLREVLHTSKGKRVAIFYVRKRK